MPNLKILHVGNPVLRTVAKPVTRAELADPSFQTFLDALVACMREANGAGLAAPQVGKEVRVFAVEVKDNPRYPYKPEIPLTLMINPEIEFLTDDRYANLEGCLSVPGIRGEVPRCPHIRVTGLDREGHDLSFETFGISAGTFQHENDHLNGILFLDRVEDPKTFCTWDMFDRFHAERCREQAEAVIHKYGA